MSVVGWIYGSPAQELRVDTRVWNFFRKYIWNTYYMSATIGAGDMAMTKAE